MVTFLAGGTGTPKLLTGLDTHLDPAEVTVIGNTGDDVEIGGLFVTPDLDTVLFERGGCLDHDTWWGIEDDTANVQHALESFTAAAGLEGSPVYLDPDQQRSGRRLSRWRRFAAVPAFMHLGDEDRAVHHLRSALLDREYSLTEVTTILADIFDVDLDLLPMSNDPVATLIHTPAGVQHFQEYWVSNTGEPTVEDVEFRGVTDATATDAVVDTIRDTSVIIGPSNPITSIGPMLALEGIEAALHETTVVAVSPFIEDQVFSGPAADLMTGTGHTPNTAGVADIYSFADAFILDPADDTDLDRPVTYTDTQLDTSDDAERVLAACLDTITELTDH